MLTTTEYFLVSLLRSANNVGRHKADFKDSEAWVAPTQWVCIQGLRATDSTKASYNWKTSGLAYLPRRHPAQRLHERSIQQLAVCTYYESWYR